MISNVNDSRSLMYAFWFYLKTVEDTQKSENTIQKGLKERIQNHILHVKFER